MRIALIFFFLCALALAEDGIPTDSEKSAAPSQATGDQVLEAAGEVEVVGEEVEEGEVVEEEADEGDDDDEITFLAYLDGLEEIRRRRYDESPEEVSLEPKIPLRDWTVEQVCVWLREALSLGHLYCRQNITGHFLATMDTPSELGLWKVKLPRHQQRIFDAAKALGPPPPKTHRDIWWCGSCAGRPGCCQSCGDVMRAYADAGWALSWDAFDGIEQCQGGGDHFFHPSPSNMSGAGLEELLLTENVTFTLADNDGRTTLRESVPKFYKLAAGVLYTTISQPRFPPEPFGIYPFKMIDVSVTARLLNGTVVIPKHEALVAPLQMVPSLKLAVSYMRQGETWEVWGDRENSAQHGLYPIDEERVVTPHKFYKKYELRRNLIIYEIRINSVGDFAKKARYVKERPHEKAKREILEGIEKAKQEKESQLEEQRLKRVAELQAKVDAKQRKKEAALEKDEL